MGLMPRSSLGSGAREPHLAEEAQDPSTSAADVPRSKATVIDFLNETSTFTPRSEVREQLALQGLLLMSLTAWDVI